MSATDWQPIYLRDGNREIDAYLRSVCRTAGGAERAMSVLSLDLRGYAETREAAAAALRTARRPPNWTPHAKAKRALYGAQYNAFRRRFETLPGGLAVAWNGIKGTRRAFMQAARDAGRGTVFLERSPLPERLTVDPVGINEENGLPRDPEFYRAWADRAPGRDGEDWRALSSLLTARAPKRHDVAQAAAGGDLADSPFLFVPLQVPDDTQIRQFPGWTGGMEGFLAALSDAVPHLPAGWHLRLKEHPSSKIPLTAPLAAMQARHGRQVVVDNATDTFAQVAASRAVVTLNSSVGLQSFFFDRPVLVLGRAFFRIPGLVTPIDGPTALAAAFAGGDALTWDASLRDAFMNYLDQVYYPPTGTAADGTPIVDAERVRRILAGA